MTTTPTRRRQPNAVDVTTTAPDPAPRRGRPPVGRRFPMTLPDNLRAQLEVAAAESGRSLSAECTARLAASFAPTRRRKSTGLGENNR